MFDQQLTFDGDAEDIAPATKQDRLFTAPKTIQGQTAMDTDTPRQGLTTREKRERKAERLREWGAKREQKAAEAFEASRAATEHIPFGQPIIVGHYSERRMRGAYDRAGRAMDKACEHSAKASDMLSRADNIEHQAAGAIYSDDADALERLAEKVTKLERQRDAMKAANAEYKKVHKAELKAEPSTFLRNRMLPFPSYAITNIGATIRTAQKRLAELQQPETGRRLTVKWAGECRTCGETIEPGAVALYFKRSKALQCEGCAG